MPATNHESKLSWTAIGILLLIPVAQLGLSRFFDNNWGLSHWLYMPWWFGFVWAVFVVAAGSLVLILSKAGKVISRGMVILLMAIVFIILVLFRFDSFLFAAGNIRVAEIAQRDFLLIRWFEYGSFYAVHLLYKLLSLLSLESNTAGVWAWRGLSFVGALASVIGTAKIAGLLSRDSGRRVILFAVLFFGPHILPLFGLVGYSAVVVAFTVWFTYFGLKTMRGDSWTSLVFMWLVLLAGITLHVSIVYLVPAAVFATSRSFVRDAKGTQIGLIGAIVAFAGMIVMLYLLASSRLEWLVELLPIKGKNPFSDYGLFSMRHLGDMLQLIVGYVPQIILAGILGLFANRTSSSGGGIAFAGVLAISGLAVAFVFDPSNGIPADIPILVAYLFGISLLAGLICERLWSTSDRKGLSLGLIPTVVIGALISYAPIYTKIANADPYLTRYYDQHKEYYSTACYAFRDAYFYNKNLDKANEWEVSIKYRSDYYINITGVSNLIQSNDNNEALRTLRWVRSEFPYHVEPQRLTATAQLNVGRFDQAKLHIDTCFMLQPYGRENFRSLYHYYRDQQQYAEAVRTLERALNIFDNDLDFTVDLLISYYRLTDYVTADSLCNVVLERDAKQPYPYLIRGLIAEMGNLPGMATVNYRRFLELAPREPEAAFVQNRLDSLKVGEKP